MRHVSFLKAMSELKELVDQYDVDCLVLTHSGKPSANDSDDPFDKIIGSTALQASRLSATRTLRSSTSSILQHLTRKFA